MRYRHTTNWQKVLKDYAVPLVGLLLILILILSYSFWSKSSTPTTSSTSENKVGLNVSLDSPDTEAYVTYQGSNAKNKIDQSVELFKGEKVNVKSGSVTLSNAELGNFKLDKWGELKYELEGSLALYSSDLWIKNISPIVVNMRYAKVNIGERSVVNLSQNEVGSTAYHISGFADVSNIAGKSTVLAKWQKITILRTDAAKTDVDVSLLKEDIDDYFKASDWFLKNGGETLILNTKKVEAATGATTQTGAVTKGPSVVLSNLQDEQTFKESSITISGKVSDSSIAFVAVEWVKVPVRESDKGFDIKGIQLTQKVNDFILKTYDGSGNIITKYPYTVYLDGAALPKTDKKNLFEVKNYPLDSSKFKFISPKDNPYTTTDKILTLEGTIPENIVDKIDVNDFVLTKFPKNGTYWKYHINADYGNLKDGLNIYEVKYFGKDGALIYKNAFTIIKKPDVTSKVISGEATPPEPSTAWQ